MRLTPQIVNEAYKATGLTPISGRWSDGYNGACEATAVAIMIGRCDTDKAANAHLLDMANWLGLPPAYLWGFTDAIDGTPAILTHSIDYYKHGYEDGLLVKNRKRN